MGQKEHATLPKKVGISLVAKVRHASSSARDAARYYGKRDRKVTSTSG